MDKAAAAPQQPNARHIALAITVAALGYFVDIYDLILFGVVRVDSLTSLGVTGGALTTEGEMLLNWQMGGMLIGGLLWGVLGDKRGRLSVLFGSIFMYSVANILNAFVTDMTSYATLRFIAGIGLAGELGAGITLVSELMSKEKRGIGATVVAAFGLLGAVVAGLVGGYDWNVSMFGRDWENWRIAYIVGGALGFALLLLRIGVVESGMFSSMKTTNVKKGSLSMLLLSRERLFKYLNCILIGLPLWFMVGILVFQSKEFGEALNLPYEVDNGLAIMLAYTGLVVGDLASGFLSQLIRSRKKTVFIFLGLCTVVIYYYLNMGQVSETHFYTVSFLLGFTVGYWAIFVTVASEQFGTNLRSTVTTTVPNFVRGSLVPITFVYVWLREDVYGNEAGANVAAAHWVAGVCLLIAGISLYYLKETFGKDLDYFEEDAPLKT